MKALDHTLAALALVVVTFIASGLPDTYALALWTACALAVLALNIIAVYRRNP